MRGLGLPTSTVPLGCDKPVVNMGLAENVRFDPVTRQVDYDDG